LTCRPNTWSGSPRFAFSWLRDGLAIARQTRSTYRLGGRDAGHAIQCRVAATNAGGTVVAESAPRVAAAACIVPRVAGLTVSAAGARLRSAHCALGHITRTRSAVRIGRVIRAGLAVGANRRAGTRVPLIVSRGRR
jgi:hypothetical protein